LRKYEDVILRRSGEKVLHRRSEKGRRKTGKDSAAKYRAID